MVLVVNHVSRMKTSFPPHRFDLLLVFLPSKLYADSDIYADLKSLREKHASRSILEAAELREAEDGWAFRNEEDTHVAAEKQLYEANGQVWALQRHPSQAAQDSTAKEPADINNKQASPNGSE